MTAYSNFTEIKISSEDKIKNLKNQLRDSIKYVEETNKKIYDLEELIIEQKCAQIDLKNKIKKERINNLKGKILTQEIVDEINNINNNLNI